MYRCSTVGLAGGPPLADVHAAQPVKQRPGRLGLRRRRLTGIGQDVKARAEGREGRLFRFPALSVWMVNHYKTSIIGACAPSFFLGIPTLSQLQESGGDILATTEKSNNSRSVGEGGCTREQVKFEVHSRRHCFCHVCCQLLCENTAGPRGGEQGARETHFRGQFCVQFFFCRFAPKMEKTLKRPSAEPHWQNFFHFRTF